MPQEPWHPGKDAKSDRIIQLNCREVHTYASYKTTRTSELLTNFVRITSEKKLNPANICIFNQFQYLEKPARMVIIKHSY